jgi:hypothetical protein
MKSYRLQKDKVAGGCQPFLLRLRELPAIIVGLVELRGTPGFRRSIKLSLPLIYLKAPADAVYGGPREMAGRSTSDSLS